MTIAFLRFALVKKSPLPIVFFGYLFIFYGALFLPPLMVVSSVIVGVLLLLWGLIVWVDWPLHKRWLLSEQRREDARLDTMIGEYEMTLMNEDMGEPYYPARAREGC